MIGIKCWSCGGETTTERISYNDGFCPYCMAECCLDETVPEVSYHLAIKTIKNLFVNAAGNINATDWKLDSNGSYYCTVTIYIMNDGKTKVLKELDKKELHIIVRDIISIVENYGYNKPVVIYNRCKDRDGDDVTIKITLVDRNGT